MKITPTALLLCLWIGLPAHAADVNLSGYLSFDYSKGLAESAFPKGRIGGLEGGLTAAGLLNPRFNYALELSFRPEGNVSLEQAWVEYAASSTFALRFGLIPVPFGRFNLINRPHLSTLVRAPLNAADLVPRRWREIGLEASGEIAGFYYAFYIGNGLREAGSLAEGQQLTDNNSDKGRGFRVGAALSESISVGYSRYWGRYDIQDSRDLRMQAVDAAWTTQGFQLVYERIWTDMENPEGYEKGRGSGDYIIGAFVFSQFRPFVSFQRLEVEDPFHGPWLGGSDPAPIGIFRTNSRWAAGLIFQPAESLFLKAEYDWNREEREERRDDLLTIQIALRF
jgi:hypothetical protein